MIASCVVMLSNSRFEIADLSRAPFNLLKNVSAAFDRTSIRNKCCSRSERFTASMSAADICPVWMSPAAFLAV